MKLTIKTAPIPVKMGVTTIEPPIKTGSTMPVVVGASFATYTHDQMVASKSWEITHDLNCYPSVSIVDTGGNIVIGEVQYISEKKLIISFSNSFSGKAYIN